MSGGLEVPGGSGRPLTKSWVAKTVSPAGLYSLIGAAAVSLITAVSRAPRRALRYSMQRALAAGPSFPRSPYLPHWGRAISVSPRSRARNCAKSASLLAKLGIFVSDNGLDELDRSPRPLRPPLLQNRAWRFSPRPSFAARLGRRAPYRGGGTSVYYQVDHARAGAGN